MSLLELQYWPAEVLRTVASPVTEFDEALLTTLEDMAETMYVERGIGLAAPQVGISKRMIVIDVPTEDEEVVHLQALVNPEIIEGNGELPWEEGCLSFPGLTVEVVRKETIKVRFQDHEGTWHEMEASGLKSVCIQHELDHLNGVNFIDHVSPLKRKLLLRELKKNLTELGVEP